MAKATKKSKAKGGSMREKAKKKAEKNMSRGGNQLLAVPEGANFLKAKKRLNMDILPYTVSVHTHPEVQEGDLWYQRTYFAHFGIGSDNKAFVCPKTIKKPCPICEYVKELFNSDDEDNVKMAKEIKAKEREIYNVIDLDDQEKGVQLFEMSYHLFGKALDEEINEGSEELGDFAELEGGKTLDVHFRKKKWNNNEFFEVRKIDFDDRDDYDEDILDDVFDLDKLLIIKDYETLRNALFDTEDEERDEEDVDEEDEEEDEDEKKKSKKKSSKKSTTKKKSSKKSSKDEDEDDEDDEDDEEEEEKSKRGKKSSKSTSKKKSKKKSDEDDEDDEDEKPKSNKKSKKKSSSKSKKKSDENECPHGGTFGEDTDELEECENCELWIECEEAKEANEEDDED